MDDNYIPDLILSVLLTWILYSAPIMFYAFIGKSSLTKSKAIAIDLIYCAFAFVAMCFIKYFADGVPPSFSPLAFWGWFNYRMLKRRIDPRETEEEPAPEPAVPDSAPVRQISAKEAFPIDSQPAQEDPHRNDPVMHYGINTKTYLEAAFSMYMSGRFSADAFRKICDQSDNGVYYDLDKLAERLRKKKDGE